MPITYTNTKRDQYGQVTEREVTTQYDGRVVEVRQYNQVRNVSDTLDYSDYQTVKVTEALVYFGRTVGDKPMWLNHRNLEPGTEIPVNERFGWVDCTNTFAYRSGEVRVPTVDAFPLGVGLTDANFGEDYAAWKACLEEQARIEAEKRRQYEEAQRKAREEAEHNRPVKGKKMVVFKGRKVKVGTVGTVAYIHENGGVLLKDDDKWQDRKAPGVWVNACNLKAR